MKRVANHKNNDRIPEDENVRFLVRYMDARFNEIDKRFIEVNDHLFRHDVLFEKVFEILDSHSKILDSHTKILDSHTKILDLHTRKLDSHSEMIGEMLVDIHELKDGFENIASRQLVT